jgi:hypothetical protein
MIMIWAFSTKMPVYLFHDRFIDREIGQHLLLDKKSGAV